MTTSRRNFVLGIGSAAVVAGWPAGMIGSAGAATPRPRIDVGPQRPVKTLAQAARQAVEGAELFVDAGDYVGDTAVWTKDGLDLRAVGGRVRLLASGQAVEGKGIWVVRARAMSVEGFDFEGAAVADRNGAGIRLDRGSLTVRDCSFVRNEMGILTSNDPDIELVVENSEFAHNTEPDGQSHLLYAGAIKRLSVTGSYFHHANAGHLLKSRAAVNRIVYNRLTDEADGHASYELEFPNGGLATVVGNIIQQAPASDNPHLVSYGAEGYRWPRNELHLVHNTLVDDRAEPGVFLRVAPGGVLVRVVNNLLVGSARWSVGTEAEMRNNLTLGRADLGTAAADAYHPRAAAVAQARVVDVAARPGEVLLPERQYLHPRRTAALVARPSIPGALQPVASTRP